MSYDYNEIFEDGISRERRMGRKENTLEAIFGVVLVILTAILVYLMTHYGF